MMKHRIRTTLATAVAFAATSLIAAPAVMAEAPLTKQVLKKKELSQSQYDRDQDYRDDRDLDGRESDRRDHDRNRDRDRNHDRRDRGRTALIECGSGDYDSNSCRINVQFKVQDARVYKRRSKSDCDRGEDWGLRGDRIWVRDGCRAVFEVSNSNYPRRGHRDGYRDVDPWHGRDRDWDGYRNVGRYEIRSAIRTCENYGYSRALDRGRLGAAYLGRPDVDIGRRGAIRINGDMKVWGRKRVRYVDTHCVVKHGRVIDFNVIR